MTDKEILAEVYKMCCNPFERCDVKSFIEEEWQKEDEIEAKLDKTERKERGQKKADAKSLGQFSKTWYKGDKRHRELEIGEDGTVKKIL